MKKTIKQIADELGVSKQAIFKKIKQEPLSTVLKNELTVDGNTVYVSDKGLSIIKSAFRENKSTTVNHKPVDEKTTTNDVVYGLLKQTIETLQEQLKVKDNQLEIKDRHIEDLTATIKAQAQSINADNQKALAEKIIEGQQLISGTSDEQQEPIQSTAENKTGLKVWFIKKLGGTP